MSDFQGASSNDSITRAGEVILAETKQNTNI